MKKIINERRNGSMTSNEEEYFYYLQSLLYSGVIDDIYEMPEVFKQHVYFYINNDTGCLSYGFNDEPMTSVWTLSEYESSKEFYSDMETLDNK